jgi:hypothetical protein
MDREIPGVVIGSFIALFIGRLGYLVDKNTAFYQVLTSSRQLESVLSGGWEGYPLHVKV